MSSRFALAVLVVVAAQGCSSVESSATCTLIGCVDGFDLQLSPNAAWPAAEYRFELEAGGVKQVCTGKLPLPPCASRALTCVGNAIGAISESGCALPAPQHAFSGITFAGKPARVRVIVQKDSVAVLDREFVPAYVTSRPNGPKCEPICTSASETATVTF